MGKGAEVEGEGFVFRSSGDEPRSFSNEEGELSNTKKRNETHPFSTGWCSVRGKNSENTFRLLSIERRNLSLTFSVAYLKSW